MDYVFEELVRGQYVLLVPPHNRPLIDGKTGQMIRFTTDDVNMSRLSMRCEALSIIQSLEALS